ncbi:thioredoxin family protein [bacterium]|nr:thioredoxin family protein [bacterium]
MINDILSYSNFNELLEQNQSLIVVFISKVNYDLNKILLDLQQTKLKVYLVNVDDLLALKTKYKIKQTPTLVVFENQTAIFNTCKLILISEILKQDKL